MTPASWKPLEHIVCEDQEFQCDLVHVELFVIEHALPSARPRPKLRTFRARASVYGHGHGHVYGGIQGQALSLEWLASYTANFSKNFTRTRAWDGAGRMRVGSRG